MADMQDSTTPKASGSHAGKHREPSLPFKYKLPFYGRMYQAWSKFIHKHGYHYAPRQYPPEPHSPRIGLGGTVIREWYHWCQWCGLRGSTIDVRGSGLVPPDPNTTTDTANSPNLPQGDPHA